MENSHNLKFMHYNNYDRQLTDEEIAQGEHRKFVGSLWHEIGKLQFEFLISRGLKPNHKLLDLGCGALRGGIHFINYLNKSNYTGIDANQSLLKAGYLELEHKNLGRKKPNLILDQHFNHKIWGKSFDYVISISLFTHLPYRLVEKCIDSVNKCLCNNGKFYSTFFSCLNGEYNNINIQHPKQIKTFSEKDPYHQTFDMIYKTAKKYNMNTSYAHNWNHPRGQRMLVFTKY